MFDQQRLRDDGSRPTRSQQSGQRGQEMHEERQKVTHGLRSYRYQLSLQVYEMRAICGDNTNSPGTGPAAHEGQRQAGPGPARGGHKLDQLFCFGAL